MFWLLNTLLHRIISPWDWYRADSLLVSSHWETALLCNDVSHWLGANLESALWYEPGKPMCPYLYLSICPSLPPLFLFSFIFCCCCCFFCCCCCCLGLLFLPVYPPLSFFNTLRSSQNGRHFSDDIFKCISWMKTYKFRGRFHLSLFPRVELTILQHWFR